IDCVDEIAYNTADLDDALEAELLDLNLLRKEVPLFGEVYAKVDATHPVGREKLKFNEALKQVFDLLATDLISSTQQAIQGAGVQTLDDVRKAHHRLAQFSAPFNDTNAQLKRFLFAHIYDHPAITEDRDRSVQCLEDLFNLYLSKFGSMPPSYEEQALSESRPVVVCDYIAGMTDQFLLRQHHEHFGV
ncbi:MAG TPA: deoxyguanosinetriphosphate triphosphohydrolase, partial [Bacteroidota bacterium]|nr:deoxyguanosinetriphosphate triphosphohydrolase [Bacteroidota bacterium]